MANVAMLGTGLIGLFYTMSLHGKRSRDRVVVVRAATPSRRRPSRSGAWRAGRRSGQGDRGPGHRPSSWWAAQLPAQAGGAGRGSGGQSGSLHQAPGPNPGMRWRCWAVEKAGVFHGYLEDLVYNPKVLKAAQSVAAGRRGPRAVDPLSRNAPRTAQRLVLGPESLRRRRHRGHGLPLHRDRADLRGQGGAARGGRVLGRHPGPPDRGGGQRRRPGALRERGHRAVRGELEFPRRHGPARRGGGQRGHDLDQPLAAHRLRDVHRRRAGRLRGREGRGGPRLAVPRGRRGGRAGIHGHVLPHAGRAGLGSAAGGNLLRRLRGERDHGRLLPLRALQAMGAGRAAGVARERGRAGPRRRRGVRRGAPPDQAGGHARRAHQAHPEAQGQRAWFPRGWRRKP